MDLSFSHLQSCNRQETTAIRIFWLWHSRRYIQSCFTKHSFTSLSKTLDPPLRFESTLATQLPASITVTTTPIQPALLPIPPPCAILSFPLLTQSCFGRYLAFFTSLHRLRSSAIARQNASLLFVSWTAKIEHDISKIKWLGKSREYVPMVRFWRTPATR